MTCETSEDCGASWLLDLRFLGLVALMLIALVYVATRLMR